MFGYMIRSSLIETVSVYGYILYSNVYQLAAYCLHYM